MTDEAEELSRPAEMICLQTLSGKELVFGDAEVEDISLQRGDTLKAMKQHVSTLVGRG